MIENNLQLVLTKRWIEQFLRTKAELERREWSLTDIEKLELAAIKNQVAELEAETRKYEARISNCAAGNPTTKAVG